ncbi:MAG TPA: glycosyltransferase, partial [Acidimicrobiales bacterium]|nr:glycosyltransferase [Acidimicrobiales bacterium]
MTVAAPGPAVSVVVPTRDRPGPLAACLAALEAQTAPSYEVVVVDDGSLDPAAKLPIEGPTKLDPKEVEEPTAEDLEAISADMIGI